MNEKDLIISNVQRFLKTGGLAGRVASSILKNMTFNLFRSEISRKRHQGENLMKNAQRIVETLGKLKGGVMKVGQMLSLQEALLPKEVTEILSVLQKDAPSVPFEKMKNLLRRELKEQYKLIDSINPIAYASASIGQVHKGKLKDGKDVAIKIQYPKIQQIVKSDIKNLKTLLKSLFSLFIKSDLTPILNEVEERLLEEIDYVIEADHLEKMHKLYSDNPKIIVPRVIKNLSSERVLTMEFVEGIPARRAASENFSQESRNKWGKILFDFEAQGLLKHRYLHADPNFSNFSFLEDGSLIVYDFGCVKKVPQKISLGFARLFESVIKNSGKEIPSILKDMGVYRVNGDPLPFEITTPYFDQFKQLFRKSPSYSFKQNSAVIKELMKLDKMYWNKVLDVNLPKDLVFINRMFAGHFGNLGRLQATADWHEIAYRYAKDIAPF